MLSRDPLGQLVGPTGASIRLWKACVVCSGRQPISAFRSAATKPSRPPSIGPGHDGDLRAVDRGDVQVPARRAGTGAAARPADSETASIAPSGSTARSAWPGGRPAGARPAARAPRPGRRRRTRRGCSRACSSGLDAPARSGCGPARTRPRRAAGWTTSVRSSSAAARVGRAGRPGRAARPGRRRHRRSPVSRSAAGRPSACSGRSSRQALVERRRGRPARAGRARPTMPGYCSPTPANRNATWRPRDRVDAAQQPARRLAAERAAAGRRLSATSDPAVLEGLAADLQRVGDVGQPGAGCRPPGGRPAGRSASVGRGRRCAPTPAAPGSGGRLVARPAPSSRARRLLDDHVHVGAAHAERVDARRSAAGRRRSGHGGQLGVDVERAVVEVDLRVRGWCSAGWPGSARSRSASDGLDQPGRRRRPGRGGRCWS